MNHKYVGHILVLTAIVFRIGGPADDPGRFAPAARLQQRPGWTFSDMNGFGPFLEPFVWFKLYWAAWALLLAVVTMLFWVRGDGDRRADRRHCCAARATSRRDARMTGVAVALILVVGGFVFYNTNVLNEYTRAQTRRERRRPSTSDGTGGSRSCRSPASPPRICAWRFIPTSRPSTYAALSPCEPHRRRRSTRSMWCSGTEIRHALISLRPSGQARARRRGDRYRIFALEQPLEPGDSVQLTFDVTFRPRGFRGTSGMQTDVVRNGAYFDRDGCHSSATSRRSSCPRRRARKRFALGPQPPMPVT